MSTEQPKVWAVMVCKSQHDSENYKWSCWEILNITVAEEDGDSIKKTLGYKMYSKYPYIGKLLLIQVTVSQLLKDTHMKHTMMTHVLLVQ